MTLCCADCGKPVSRREDHERIARTAIERFDSFDSWVNNVL
jgi:hypothetical protein